MSALVVKKKKKGRVGGLLRKGREICEEESLGITGFAIQQKATYGDIGTNGETR